MLNKRILILKKHNFVKTDIISVSTNSLNINIVTGRNIQENNEIILHKDMKGFILDDIYDVWLENGKQIKLKIVGFYDTYYVQDTFSGIMFDEELLNNSFDHIYSKVYTSDPKGAGSNKLEYYKNNPSFNMQMAAAFLLTLISFLFLSLRFSIPLH